MVNRRAFFEIFFYNRENRSREMMEAAESVWRAYMKKYGLGLDAGNDGQPTYEEVKEITYLANAAIEVVEKQMAEAAAEEEKRKKLQKEAWDLGIFVPMDTATVELEKLVLKAMKQEQEAEEEPEEEVPEETIEEPVEEPVEEPAEEPAVQILEEIPEEVSEEKPAPQIREEKPVSQIPVEKPAVKAVPMERPAVSTSVGTDIDLWVAQLVSWCRNKGLECITTMDEGDCYLHVYLPHKAEVHTVGKWCFKKDTKVTDLAAEITKLYAYCEGFVDCFTRLMQ